MSFRAEEQAIWTRINTVWGTTTPIAWPNIDFDPDTDVGDSDPGFIRVTILRGPLSATQADMAENPRYRHEGTLAIQVFVPANEGSGPALSLADTLADGFRGITADGITYRAPAPDPVGVSGAWYQVNLWIPFYRDEVFS